MMIFVRHTPTKTRRIDMRNIKREDMDNREIYKVANQMVRQFPDMRIDEAVKCAVRAIYGQNPVSN